MAEPIPNNKRSDVTAPTPQNTPATNAPISSHAQQPGVASIMEEGANTQAASVFARHPHLVQMIQGKLNHLIGQSSGYIESLPLPVQRRVTGLQGIQKEHSKLEAEFQEEVFQLEKKYFAKFQPLYTKRRAIITGDVEPTEEEIAAGEVPDEDDEEEAKPEKTEAAAPSGEGIKGIPEFWLSAMKHHTSLVDIITDRDEAALKYLTDVRLEYLDKFGFKLIFEFAENEFFSNQIITKSYFYNNESGYGGEFLYDHAEGDKIQWKEGKDLTVIIESKKQRNKNTKQTRIVKKTVPTDSFFNFFSPPKTPGEDDSVDDELEQRLELDYQLGEDLKEKLIPHAIDWFTGKALQFEELDEPDLDDDDEFDDDDDEENMNDDDDEEEDSEEDDDGAKPKQETECKQS